LLEWEAETAAPAGQPAAPRFVFDADAMLKTGEHPLGKVQACSSQLAPGESILIRSSFRPAPLIAMFESQGFDVQCVEREGRNETSITRRP